MRPEDEHAIITLLAETKKLLEYISVLLAIVLGVLAALLVLEVW